MSRNLTKEVKESTDRIVDFCDKWDKILAKREPISTDLKLALKENERLKYIIAAKNDLLKRL